MIVVATALARKSIELTAAATPLHKIGLHCAKRAKQVIIGPRVFLGVGGQSMEVVVIVLVVAGLITAIALIANYYEKQRTKKIEEIAGQLGLDFHVKDITNVVSRFTDLNLFRLGGAKRAANVLTGETDEVRISIFDYQYTVGSGKNQSTPKQTVTSLESPRLRCPTFSMRPENLFDKVGSVLGFQDIDFESHPEFSRAYVLKGENEAAIREFFTTGLLDFFAQRPGLSVEASNGRLICYRANKRVGAEEYQKLLAEAYQVFGEIVDRG
jgi:hypothetical protein